MQVSPLHHTLTFFPAHANHSNMFIFVVKCHDLHRMQVQNIYMLKFRAFDLDLFLNI